MHQTCAITCLNPSIEKQSTVNPLKRRNINLVTSSIQRRLWMFEDNGEQFRTCALTDSSPLFNRIGNFFLERQVHSRRSSPICHVSRLSALSTGSPNAA